MVMDQSTETSCDISRRKGKVNPFRPQSRDLWCSLYSPPERTFCTELQYKDQAVFHLIDSQMVLGAIQRESYGYKTFFGDRIGEIQETKNVEDWWWIKGNLNISDIVTCEAESDNLKEVHHFCTSPQRNGPLKSAKDVTTEAKEEITNYKRKDISRL